MLKRVLHEARSYNKKQLETLKDILLLVDYNDNIIGRIDKETAHLNSWIFSTQGKPHRAFSMFIFNQQKQLLLQQRSECKITFPLHWTNSCCSHPINAEDEKGSVKEAIKRTLFELGSGHKLEEESIRLIGKILYKAKSDEYWGEYELDYLIFSITQEGGDMQGFNKEEVHNVKWVDIKDVRDFAENTKMITPWFQKIVLQTSFLKWWEEYFYNKKDFKGEKNIIQVLE